ncbi:MAG: Imm26 family immunity protein [Dehalococcoidia bacterium]
MHVLVVAAGIRALDPFTSFSEDRQLASENSHSYSEGDFFAVPLKSGGFGVGIAVCVGPRGTVVGRFFGPTREAVPTMDELGNLTEDDSIHVEHFRDDGLKNGSWEVIGRHPMWDSYEWPILKFGWFQTLASGSGGKAFEMELDEDLRTFRQKEISREQFEKLPYEGVVASKAAEITLTLVLTRPGWKPKLPG